MTRVVVVGGGLIGLCCARELTRLGADVTVVDGGRGSGATLGNAGWVVPVLAAPLTASLRPALPPHASLGIHPTLGLLRWVRSFLGSSGGLEALLGLAVRSVELFDSWDVPCETHHTGLVMAARTPAGVRTAVAIAEAARSAGYDAPFDVHDGKSLARLEPALADLAGGVHARGERHVRPESFVAALRTEVVRAEVFGVSPERDHWQVRTSRGSLDADRVVVAAGAWSAKVLGVDLPLLPGKGYSITAHGTGVAPRHALKLVEANVACTPFADGVRLAGRFELGNWDTSVRPRKVNGVIRSAGRYFSSWTPGPDRLVMAGLRPSTPDSLPLIGAVRGLDGVFVATGHGMLGLTLGPATASLLAPLVVHDRAAPELEPFDPGRFENSLRRSVITA